MIIFLIFIIGLFFGSFLGVISDRLPLGKGIVTGRSKCDFCKKELGVLDLIPLFSFAFLKGKCRYCHRKLPLFYPAIEFVTALLFAYTAYFLNFNLGAQFFFYLFIISIFTIVFFADLKHGIIPDVVILTGAAVTLLYLLFTGKVIIFLLSAFSAFFFFVFVSAIFYFLTKKIGLGGGDIKLSFLLGLVLGPVGTAVSLYVAFLTGALMSIILILWRKKKFQTDSLPFGPFLIIGALIGLFFGNIIFQEVVSLLGL